MLRSGLCSQSAAASQVESDLVGPSKDGVLGVVAAGLLALVDSAESRVDE